MANSQSAQQKIIRIRDEFRSQIIPLIRGILAEEPDDVTSYCAQYFQRLLAKRQKAVEGVTDTSYSDEEPECLQSSNSSSQTNCRESQATAHPHVQESTSLPVLTENTEKIQLRETSSWSGPPNSRSASGKRTVIFDSAGAMVPIGDQVNISAKDEEYAEETGKLGDAPPITDKNNEDYSYESSFDSNVNEEFWSIQSTDVKEYTKCMPSAPPYESDDGESAIREYFASALPLGNMQHAEDTCKYWSIQSKNKKQLYIKSESLQSDNKIDDLIDSFHECHIDEGEKSELQPRTKIFPSSTSGYNSQGKYFIRELVDDESNVKDTEAMKGNSGMHLATNAEIQSIVKNFCSSFNGLQKEFSIPEFNSDDEFSKPKDVSDIVCLRKSQEKWDETENQTGLEKNGETCYESYNSPEEENEKMIEQANTTSGRHGDALGDSYLIDSQKCLLSITKDKCNIVSKQDEILCEVHDKHEQMINSEEDAAVLVKKSKKTKQHVASNINKLQNENNLNEILSYERDKELNMMEDTKNKYGVTNMGFRADDEDDPVDESWKRKWYASHPRLDHHLSEKSQTRGPSLHPCKPQLPVPSSRRRRRNLPVIREKGDMDSHRQRLFRYEFLYGQRVQLPHFNRMLNQVQSNSSSANRNNLLSPKRHDDNSLKEREEDTSEKSSGYNISDNHKKQTHQEEIDCDLSKLENFNISEICDEKELYLYSEETEDVFERNDGKISVPEGSVVNRKELSQKVSEEHSEIKVSQNDKYTNRDFILQGDEENTVQESKVLDKIFKKITFDEKFSMFEREQNESFMQNMTPTSSSHVPLLQEGYMTSSSNPELLNCLQTAENIDLCTFLNNERTGSKLESLNADSNESLCDGHEFNLGILAEGDRASSQDTAKKQTASNSKISPKSTDVEPGLKSACGDFASAQNNSVVSNRQQISNLDTSFNSSPRNLNTSQMNAEVTNNISTGHENENNEEVEFSYYTDSDSFEFDSSDLSEEEGNENTDAANATAQENKQ